MELTDPPLPPEILAATPCAAQALILALQERVRELEARLGQNSSNFSRPPSSDRPQAPAKRRRPPSSRKRGGQPGHRGAFRALLPVEQVDEAVLWRKSSFGSDRETGSRFAERLLTVAATCRQQGRGLLDFLVAAGEAALHGTAAPSLLPAREGG
jgi:hypothetical protein